MVAPGRQHRALAHQYLHSNIATTLSYIEVDYDHMRSVLHERMLGAGGDHIPETRRRADLGTAIAPPASLT